MATQHELWEEFMSETEALSDLYTEKKISFKFYESEKERVYKEYAKKKIDLFHNKIDKPLTIMINSDNEKSCRINQSARSHYKEN